MPKEFIKRFFMSLGIVFTLGVMISKDFRDQLALLASPILDPLYQAMPIHLVIFILAAFTGLYSSLIQKYTIDYARLKEIQKKVMEFQKEYMDAMKKDNKFKLKQLEKEQPEIQKMQSEMMSMQFTPMFYTVVVTIPVFMWLYTKTSLNPEVVVPFQGLIHIGQPVLILPWWIFWYLLCSIAWGQVIRKALKMG